MSVRDIRRRGPLRVARALNGRVSGPGGRPPHTDGYLTSIPSLSGRQRCPEHSGAAAVPVSQSELTRCSSGFFVVTLLRKSVMPWCLPAELGHALTMIKSRAGRGRRLKRALSACLTGRVLPSFSIRLAARLSAASAVLIIAVSAPAARSACLLTTPPPAPHRANDTADGCPFYQWSVSAPVIHPLLGAAYRQTCAGCFFFFLEHERQRLYSLRRWFTFAVDPFKRSAEIRCAQYLDQFDSALTLFN